MNNQNPYMYHQMPYNENFHIDEDGDAPRNANVSAENVEPMTTMENVPMPSIPAAYPYMVPTMTMPAAYPHMAPMMPTDCGCYYPTGHHYPMFTCEESGIPWTTPMFPMMNMAGTIPSMTSPVGETAGPIMGTNMPAPTISYPTVPFMHDQFTPSPSPTMEYRYDSYYPYR
jgi:hypothetical protein